MTANLVVDATGRSSRCAVWLNALGYAAPREEKIEVGFGDTTRLYRRQPEQLNGKLGAIFGARRPKLAGRCDCGAGRRSLDREPWRLPWAMLKKKLGVAKSLQKPDIYRVIREAVKQSPLMPYRFGTDLRRHDAELSRFPQGLLVYGLASRCFRFDLRPGDDPRRGRQSYSPCANAWQRGQMTSRAASSGLPPQSSRHLGKSRSSSDLQHPGVEGKRPVQLRLFNWYITRLFRAAQTDIVLTTRFLEMLNLIRAASGAAGTGHGASCLEAKSPTHPSGKSAFRGFVSYPDLGETRISSHALAVGRDGNWDEGQAFTSHRSWGLGLEDVVLGNSCSQFARFHD